MKRYAPMFVLLVPICLAAPSSGASWAVVYVKQPADKGQEVVNFLHWVLHDGQPYSAALYYAPLSPALVDRAEEKLSQITASR